MKKTYIIGIIASGKTTLARKLSKLHGINHYEVDAVVHKVIDGTRIKQSHAEQMAEFERINRESSWIIEGTYRPSCDYVLKHADRIIYVDPPLIIRRYRIVIRFIKQNLNIEACHYKSDFKMLRAMFKWTNDFERNRNDFEKMLQCYNHKLITVKSLKDYKEII